MKSKIFCLAIIFTCIITLIFCQTLISETNTEFYPVATLSDVCCILNFDNKETPHSAVQGACTDGVYAYFAIDTGNTIILKYDTRTWQLCDSITHTTLGHANDMTYNPKTRQIIISNNNPDYDVVTFINPDTLKITGSKKLPINIYSIAYNSKSDRYVAGISGGYDFAILNNNFEIISTHKGHNTGYIRQGNDCDSRYIYFAQSGASHNIIIVYDWSGKLVDTIKINKAQEIENIFHIKNTMYTSFRSYKNSVYKTSISKPRYK